MRLRADEDEKTRGRRICADEERQQRYVLAHWAACRRNVGECGRRREMDVKDKGHRACSGLGLGGDKERGPSRGTQSVEMSDGMGDGNGNDPSERCIRIRQPVRGAGFVEAPGQARGLSGERWQDP